MHFDFMHQNPNSLPWAYPEMPTFKNQKQYSQREKTVFWPKKKYFVKNNEGEGANLAANLS